MILKLLQLHAETGCTCAYENTYQAMASCCGATRVALLDADRPQNSSRCSCCMDVSDGCFQ